MNPGALSQTLLATRYADPYWANVIALIPFNDSVGAISFYDAVSKSPRWTAGGGTMTNNVRTKFWDTALQVPNSSTTAFAGPGSEWVLSGDFSIEAWMYIEAGAFSSVPLFHITSSIGTGISGGTISSTAITGTYNGISVSVGDGAGDLRGRWFHYFFGRSGTTIYIICNGIGVNSTVAAVPIGGTINPSISFGTMGSTVPSAMTYYSDARVTRGVCRYTAPFAVPTAPYPQQ